MSFKYSYKIFQILLNLIIRSRSIQVEIRIISNSGESKSQSWVECGSNWIWNPHLKSKYYLEKRILRLSKSKIQKEPPHWHWYTDVGNICSVCIFLWQERWISGINNCYLFPILYQIEIFYLQPVFHFARASFSSWKSCNVHYLFVVCSAVHCYSVTPIQFIPTSNPKTFKQVAHFALSQMSVICMIQVLSVVL